MIKFLEQHERPRMTVVECLLQGEFPVEALPYILKDTQEHPEHWGHWNNLGICYKYLGNYNDAVESFKRSLEANPAALQAHHNLAMAYEELGRFQDALRHYVVSTSNSTNENAQYGFAGCALREKKYDVAAPIWEAARFAKRSAYVLPNVPIWRGQDLAGQKLLVTREGGYGDIFWMLRYLEPLKAMGAHITFHLFTALAPLLRGHEWIDRILVSEDALNAQEFDYQVPLWSIMWELRKLGLQDIPMPMRAPYIKVDRPARFDAPTVGICWKAGEILASHRKLRSIQDEYLDAFADVPVRWISMVPGEQPSWCLGAVDKDWTRTAQTLAGLDLVVAADSSVFHLAGAMGRPTIVFTPLGSDWKFFHSDHCEWYPTVKVIRNSSPTSFKPVVDQLVQEVTAWAEQGVAS